MITLSDSDSDSENESQEKVIYNPYNTRNKFVTKQDIEEILSRNGVKQPIRDLSIYQKSFIHKSYLRKDIQELDSNREIVIHSKEYLEENNIVDLQEESQERLEFLGDSVAGLIVCKYIWERYPNQDEGFLTKLKIRLVCSSQFANFARYCQLYKHLIISRHAEEVCNGRKNQNILEDTFEAFIGALHNDLGYRAAEKFLISIIEKKVDFAQLISVDDNYKDQLMRYFQKHHKGYTPTYHEISRSGRAGNKEFKMGVKNHLGEIVAYGIERTKKEAEKLAAKQLLIDLGVIEIQ